MISVASSSSLGYACEPGPSYHLATTQTYVTCMTQNSLIYSHPPPVHSLVSSIVDTQASHGTSIPNLQSSITVFPSITTAADTASMTFTNLRLNLVMSPNVSGAEDGRILHGKKSSSSTLPRQSNTRKGKQPEISNHSELLLKTEFTAAQARIVELDASITDKDKRIAILQARLDSLEEKDNNRIYEKYFSDRVGSSRNFHDHCCSRQSHPSRGCQWCTPITQCHSINSCTGQNHNCGRPPVFDHHYEATISRFND